MSKRFSISAVFEGIDKITAPVSRMQNKVGRFTRKMQRGFKRVNHVYGKLITGIKTGAKIGVAALGTMAFALGNLIGIGADFGRAIGSAAAKFPGQIKRGTKEFKALAAAAREVGANTEFTATQAAQGLNFLAKAGFTAEAAISSLGPIVDFATASEMELAEASDIASDALGAFGLDSKDAGKKLIGLQRVMDVMSLTANRTNTSVSELFEAVKKGGPVAVAAGSNIETFSATMGFLASNGIKAAQAGTAAKNVTLALAGVGNKAAATFKKLGISLVDANGDLRDQLDVLDDLRNSTSKMASGKKVNVINAIFGKIPIAAATKLLSSAGKSVRGLRTELENAGGSSKRVAGFIRDDVKGSIDGLKSAVEGVKISIFSLNEGPLKGAIDKMTEWVRANEAAIATGIGDFLLFLVNNFENIISAAKDIGKVVAIFLVLSFVLKGIIAILTIINLLVAANPIVLAVIAVVAAVVVLLAFIDKIKASFDKLPLILKLAFAPIWLAIKALKFMKDKIVSVLNLGSGLGKLFGFGGDDESKTDQSSTEANPKLVTPEERTAKIISEQTTTNKSEVTIKSGDGATAEVTSGSLGSGITLQPSGAF
jgi:TP901 family phage tail tape measure protein